MNQEFKDWLNDHDKYRTWLLDHRITIENFKRIVPAAMQVGIYLEYFDSLGINIDVSHNGHWIFFKGMRRIEGVENSRHEAYTAAFDRAFEILNQEK